jgi:hypothetical protein
MSHLKPVTVGRYRNEDFEPLAELVANGDISDQWNGWVETEDWIVYEHADGSLHVFNGRNEFGGCVGSYVHIGNDGSAFVHTKQGETCIPSPNESGPCSSHPVPEP